METFFMNTKNSKTSEPYRFRYDLIDKLDLRNKNMALRNLSIHYTWKNVKSIHKNNKFKISARTWSQKFNLPDGSYNIPEIQDYFEYIITKHENVCIYTVLNMLVDNIFCLFSIYCGYLYMEYKHILSVLGGGGGGGGYFH